MTTKTIKIPDPDPRVHLGRKCIVCDEVFILPHPSSPQMMCENCRETLKEIVLERRKERVNHGIL